MNDLPANSLEHFARTADAVAATTRKLEKAALLGEYFAQLDDEDLARSARYFAGQQFALSDARTTNVGGSILSEALCASTGVELASLGPRYARWGAGGDVAFEVFSEAKTYNQPSLTLQETDRVRGRRMAAPGQQAETQFITDVSAT